MTDMNDGGPAFPVEVSFGGEGKQTGPSSMMATGMNLRDYFAAKAMQALIAKIPLHDTESEYGESSDIDNNHAIRCGVAESAYDYADAMLAHRESRHD